MFIMESKRLKIRLSTSEILRVKCRIANKHIFIVLNNLLIISTSTQLAINNVLNNVLTPYIKCDVLKSTSLYRVNTF